jgi:hypothetical protein
LWNLGNGNGNIMSSSFTPASSHVGERFYFIGIPIYATGGNLAGHVVTDQAARKAHPCG